MLDRCLISFSICWCTLCVRAMRVNTSTHCRELSCHNDHRSRQSRYLLNETKSNSTLRTSTEDRIRLRDTLEQRSISVICKGHSTRTCSATTSDHDRILSARDHSNRYTSGIRFGLNDRDRSTTETISGFGFRMPGFRRAQHIAREYKEWMSTIQ
jgi:hypothetical protein